MVKPVVNFMENYTPTPNRVFDLYNYYLGGGGANTGTGTGGQTPPGFNPFIPGGGGGGGIMNNVKSFRADPRVPAAFEAMQRSNQLASMGINDPFANEATLAGAYYGDMPEDTSGLTGKQSMFAKGIGQVKGMMDNPLFNLVGTAINPIGGVVKGIAGLANRFLPVNTRAIQEGIAGNLGISVDNIGRIVNTGKYLDPNNIMAGYNLSMIDDETFEKRIDRINKGTLSAEKKAARIALLKKAQEKIMASKKLADEARQQKELQRQLAKAQKEIAAKGYQDYGSGGADQATQDSYQDSTGNYAGASTQDHDTPD
jgi:hypothetical protein